MGGALRHWKGGCPGYVNGLRRGEDEWKNNEWIRLFPAFDYSSPASLQDKVAESHQLASVWGYMVQFTLSKFDVHEGETIKIHENSMFSTFMLDLRGCKRSKYSKFVHWGSWETTINHPDWSTCSTKHFSLWDYHQFNLRVTSKW